MGLTSSKSKLGNVTLVRSSSLSSTDDSLNTSNTIAGSCTPERNTGKVLPFDPRSPTETFARTPITVSSEVATPCVLPAMVKVLDIDPRSPSQQVSRTPIVVESSNACSSDLSAASKRSLGLHKSNFSSPFVNRSNSNSDNLTAAPQNISSSPPSKPANICTNNESQCQGNDNNDSSACSDPRSPTVTVPRTPLEDKIFEVSRKSEELTDNSKPIATLLFDTTSTSDVIDTENAGEKESEHLTETSETSRVMKNITNNGNSKQQQSKSSSSHTGGAMRTPLGILQAKQCKTVEEEFSKNQLNLLNQLDRADENAAPIPSSTQFVEQI